MDLEVSDDVFSVKTIGRLTILHGEDELELPSSLKTRALFAFLLLSGGAHSRQALCELFWPTVDDPLAALRWSLTKLRPLANMGGVERLKSDRKVVEFALEKVGLDTSDLARCADEAGVTEDDADRVWQATTGLLLGDCELPNLPEFTIWLEGQRNDLAKMRGRVARRFALDAQLSWQVRHEWGQRWRSVEPFSRGAARILVQTKHNAEGAAAASELADELIEAFQEAEISPPEFDFEPELKASQDAPTAQEIRIVSGKDGVCIAWASVGKPDNPPLLKAANWLNHLELDWESPIWSPLFRELSKSHRVIRYDERGCGLSDWDVDQITFDDFVEDLEEVVEASGIERFPLLGISQGAAVSIEYAARHPERVSKLILFGAYDCGWRLTANEQEAREREAVMVLTESGWGSDNPAYRHVFSRTFMPEANPEELDWFDEFQRQTTSPRNAVRFLEAFSTIDVRERLADIQCPTLVVHSRGDLRIPFSTGRSIAARIPDAQFAGIGSSNHLLLGRETASAEFLRLVRDFLKE